MAKKSSGSRLGRVAAVVFVEAAYSLRQLVPVSEAQPHDLNATLALFHGFHLVADLGYVPWYPNCTARKSTRSCAGDVDLEEVRCGLGADKDWHVPKAGPRRLENLDRIRRSLPRMLPYGRRETGAGYLYTLPRATPFVAAPFAASQRFDLADVDFIVGGSVLHTLATGDFSRKSYTVQRWRNAVMMHRHLAKPDFVDLTNKGLQFKRLVIGKLMNDVDPNEPFVQHLQVLRIGRYNVLFITEVDAVEESGRRAEVKTQKYPDWRQLMFQMISKGSTNLVYGTMSERGLSNLYLSQIDEYDLLDIVTWSTTPKERALYALNIVDALERIHSRVFDALASDRDLFHMNDTTWYRSEREELPWTHTPKLHLVKEKERSLLPEAPVLHALFPTTSEP